MADNHQHIAVCTNPLMMTIITDFNTFSRMNVRLDQVLDEIQEALDNLTDEGIHHNTCHIMPQHNTP